MDPSVAQVRLHMAVRKNPVVTKACGHCRRGMRTMCPPCLPPWARSSCTTPSSEWCEYGHGWVLSQLHLGSLGRCRRTPAWASRRGWQGPVGASLVVIWVVRKMSGGFLLVRMSLAPGRWLIKYPPAIYYSAHPHPHGQLASPAILQPTLPLQGGASAQVHRPSGPSPGPGRTLQGASKLPARLRATAASGTGSPGAAVGAPECAPAEVSPKRACLPPCPSCCDLGLTGPLQWWTLPQGCTQMAA